MAERTLFELPEERPAAAASAEGTGRPRLRLAERQQVVMRMLSLDQMLPADDPARIIWAYVEQLDLSELHSQFRCVEGAAGRGATDPRILLAVWLLAISRGEGRGREVARLCERHLQFQWLCGDVTLNHHTLSDFRRQQGPLVDRLLSEHLASLMHAGVVTLEHVAQDGVRVRASAGKASFRKRATLERCLQEAQEQVERLKVEVEEDASAMSRREQAARERAAEERVARVTAALAACDEVQRQKEQRGRDSLKQPARASTTDPDARVMKMADGGYRPAYNGQFATDAASQIIVGVDAVNQGSDAGLMGPMLEQVERRTGKKPQNMLVDGGFATLDDIARHNDPQGGLAVFTPVKEEAKKRQRGEDPFAPRKTDPPPLAEWRSRMGTAAAQEIYKLRAATAECVNALARNRGLQQLPIRGLAGAKAILGWFALAHNVLRAATWQASGLT